MIPALRSPIPGIARGRRAPRSRIPLAGLTFFLLFSLLGRPQASAQEGAEGSGEPRPLALEDYAGWSTIGSVALSGDGRWMTFSYEPNEGDSRFFLRDLEEPNEEPEELSLNGSRPRFSEDSHWLAFISAPPEDGVSEGSDEGRDGGDRSRTLRLLDLTSREETEVEKVASFTFSEDSRWLAVQKQRSSGGSGSGAARSRETGGRGSGGDGSGDPVRGADLILVELGTGILHNLGNVAEHAFNDQGTHLAYVVDAEGRTGNGLYLMGLADMRVLPLATGDALFEGMAWNEEGTALAVLKGNKPDGMVHRANTLLAFPELLSADAEMLAGPRPEGHRYDPREDESFPEGYVLSELRTPSWSEDGERVFLGIKEQEEAAEEEEDQANVDVWHWKDERVQSRQEAQAGRDRRSTDLAVLNLEGSRFVRLGDESLERVTPTYDGRWAVGYDDSPYAMDRDRGESRSDVYRVDPTSGERTLITQALTYPMGTSPDSRWFLYWQDRQVQAFELPTGRRVNLTEVAGGVDFENEEFDRPVEKPTYGVGGWSNDGDVVFLNLRYDVWQVSLEGGESVNLTGGMGDREKIRFRILDLDTEDDGIETSKPVFLSAYGEWTKRSGYFQARPGRDPRELLYDDAMFGTSGFRGSGIRRATGADRVLFTRQTFEDFPDYWIGDTEFGELRRVTDANPQQSGFLWGSRVLVDYTDERGNELQATLTLPAGYTEGEKYPMIIYFYEKMSQRHHQYSQPTYDDRPHMSTYASNGYMVLMPDIVYDMGYPGSSALDDVTSAARAVIEEGYADPERICLQGHSWGGYETSFILTQTDMFACVVTGAPLTNLVSMHNILYKSSGSPNAPLIEWGQGRMDTNPFEGLDRYVAESPVHHVQKISTPFLILHGTADGAVDWNQGLEYYVAARRMGKEVILLSYPDEPHHLSKEANQKDFQIRMKQFFDHHLKDAPAPTWMTEGVPYLKKDRIGPMDGVGGGG